MKQQTALEFFLIKLIELEIGKTIYENQRQDLQDAYKQAKEMEKEQIENSFDDGRIWNNSWDGQSYYEEIFNNENSLGR